MRIFLLSCVFLLAASPAFAGPGAPEGERTAKATNEAGAKNVAADRKARPALAKGKTAWPKKLRHRVSRYARFGRTLDREGDLQEQVRANMARNRVKDVQGDRIEFARAKLSERNRFASRNAVFARKRGTESDLRERQLSRLTRARSRADFRRQMLIPAHELAELKQYKLDYGRFGSPLEKNRLRMADKRGSERGADADERKKDWRVRDRERDQRYLGTRENGERERDRETDRHAERDAERDSEREADREGESEDRESEREGEREADREEDAEERSEDAETRSEERSDERTDDRADEKTIRQAEENTRDE